jgi:hypothetical protein
LPDNQSHLELHESHPMEIEKFPRKPDAEFALYNNIASSEEQLSSGKVQIGTFSEYQPQKRTRLSNRKGGASLLTVRGSVDGQIVSVLIDSGCQLESIMSIPCVERLCLVHNPAPLRAERWDGSLSPLEVVEQPLALRLGGQLDC